MATTRFTLGAVLSTVSETAATVTNAMVTVNTTVSMANAFVTKAAASQKIRYAMEAYGNEQAIADEIAMEIVAREDAVLAYCAGDANKLARYNKHHDALMVLVNTTKP